MKIEPERPVAVQRPTIEPNDCIPVGRLCWTFDTPRYQLTAMLSRAGVPVELDHESGDVVTSRAALGEIVRTALAGTA